MNKENNKEVDLIKASELLNKINSDPGLASGDPDQGLIDCLQRHLEDEHGSLEDEDLAIEVLRHLLVQYVNRGRFNRAATIFRYRHMKITKVNEMTCFNVFQSAMISRTDQAHDLCMAIFEYHIAKQPGLVGDPKNENRLSLIFEHGRAELVHRVLDCIRTTGYDKKDWLEKTASRKFGASFGETRSNSKSERRRLISRMFNLGIGSLRYHPEEKYDDLPSEELLHMMGGQDVVELTHLNRICGKERESDHRSRKMLMRFIKDLGNNEHDHHEPGFRSKIDAAALLIQELKADQQKVYWGLLANAVAGLPEHIEYLGKVFSKADESGIEKLMTVLDRCVENDANVRSKKEMEDVRNSQAIIRAMIVAKSINKVAESESGVVTQKRKRIF